MSPDSTTPTTTVVIKIQYSPEFENRDRESVINAIKFLTGSDYRLSDPVVTAIPESDPPKFMVEFVTVFQPAGIAEAKLAMITQYCQGWVDAIAIASMTTCVIVTLSGGCVQDVDKTGFFEVRTLVHDYDCQGCDPKDLKQDDDNDSFMEAEW